MAIVVTALISIPLAKKCDRKTLLGISALGVSACLFTLGTFYYLKSIDGVEGFGWLPLVDFMVYIGFFMVSKYYKEISIEMSPEIRLSSRLYCPSHIEKFITLVQLTTYP